MSATAKTNTPSKGAGRSAAGFRAPPKGIETVVPGRIEPASLTPEMIYAAHMPIRGSTVYGSPRRHMGTSIQAMARAGAERMQGTAEALTARAYKLGCEADQGLLFIAQGLFDEAHLLFTAVWAESLAFQREEMKEEARRKARAIKPSTEKKGARA